MQRISKIEGGLLVPILSWEGPTPQLSYINVINVLFIHIHCIYNGRKSIPKAFSCVYIGAVLNLFVVMILHTRLNFNCARIFFKNQHFYVYKNTYLGIRIIGLNINQFSLNRVIFKYISIDLF